jgi:hypothetical protein
MGIRAVQGDIKGLLYSLGVTHNGGGKQQEG